MKKKILLGLIGLMIMNIFLGVNLTKLTDGYGYGYGDGVWESKFDNTHWSILDDGESYGFWSGNSWTKNEWRAIILTASDHSWWTEGYRPSKMRVTFNGDQYASISLTTDDNWPNNYIIDIPFWDYTSGTELNIDMQKFQKDIIQFQMNSDNDITITNIEFFGESNNATYDSPEQPIYTRFMHPNTTNFTTVNILSVSYPVIANDFIEIMWIGTGMNLSGINFDEAITFTRDSVEIDVERYPVLNTTMDITFRHMNYPSNSGYAITGDSARLFSEIQKSGYSPVSFRIAPGYGFIKTDNSSLEVQRVNNLMNSRKYMGFTDIIESGNHYIAVANNQGAIFRFSKNDLSLLAMNEIATYSSYPSHNVKFQSVIEHDNHFIAVGYGYGDLQNVTGGSDRNSLIDMVIAKFRKSDLGLVAFKNYGGGMSTRENKLNSVKYHDGFYYAVGSTNDNLTGFNGGTQSNSTDFLIVKFSASDLSIDSLSNIGTWGQDFLNDLIITTNSEHKLYAVGQSGGNLSALGAGGMHEVTSGSYHDAFIIAQFHLNNLSMELMNGYRGITSGSNNGCNLVSMVEYGNSFYAVGSSYPSMTNLPGGSGSWDSSDEKFLIAKFNKTGIELDRVNNFGGSSYHLGINNQDGFTSVAVSGDHITAVGYSNTILNGFDGGTSSCGSPKRPVIARFYPESITLNAMNSYIDGYIDTTQFNSVLHSSNGIVAVGFANTNLSGYPGGNVYNSSYYDSAWIARFESYSSRPIFQSAMPSYVQNICTLCPDCCIGSEPLPPMQIDFCELNPMHVDCQNRPPTACTGSSCVVWTNPENITGDDGFNEDNIVLGDCFVAINSPAMDMKFNATAYLIWNNSDGHCGSNDIFMAQEFLPNADGIRAKNTRCTVCNEIAMTNDFITSFKVTHFSSYAIGGNSRLDIYDEYESASAPVDTSIAFYANFTNITSGSHIPGATCMISFDSDPTEYAMTDNGNNYNYTLAGGFSSVGTHSFHVECAATGYTTLNATDDIQVGEAGEIPEFGTVTLIAGLLIVAIAVVISRRKK